MLSVWTSDDFSGFHESYSRVVHAKSKIELRNSEIILDTGPQLQTLNAIRNQSKVSRELVHKIT